MYVVTIVFFVLPILDEYVEYDLRNPTKEEEKKLEHDIRFKIPLYISVFTDWFLTYKVISLLLTKEISILN